MLLKNIDHSHKNWNPKEKNWIPDQVRNDKIEERFLTRSSMFDQNFDANADEDEAAKDFDLFFKEVPGLISD